MTARPTISGVIVARDEAQMISGAIRSLAFCDEIVVVVDDRTTDDTATIARGFDARVHVLPFAGFDALKNAAIQLACGDWVVCCDADERVTPRLALQLREALDRGTTNLAFRCPRVNFFWGRRMAHGGWPEQQVKIARRSHAVYRGALHEVFDIPAEAVGRLTGEWWHFTHRSIADNLHKTANYATVYAEDRASHGAAPVKLWRVILLMAAEFLRRGVVHAGWRDGWPGMIELIYQPFSVFCHRVRLWEQQQGVEIADRYAALEASLEEQT